MYCAGSYRECFSASILLGHPSDPIIPQPECRLAPTQLDPASTARACLCTSDLCNLEPAPAPALQRQSKLSRAGAEQSVVCPRLAVTNADYADCSGEYEVEILFTILDI